MACQNKSQNLPEVLETFRYMSIKFLFVEHVACVPKYAFHCENGHKSTKLWSNHRGAASSPSLTIRIHGAGSGSYGLPKEFLKWLFTQVSLLLKHIGRSKYLCSTEVVIPEMKDQIFPPLKWFKVLPYFQSTDAVRLFF